MIPPVIVYPLDLTGNSPNNRIIDEPHDLPASGNRALIATHGPFFTKGLVVRSRTTGQVLIPEVQYKAILLHQEATLRSGYEICCGVVVTDDQVGHQFSIDYSVIGGEYSSQNYALEQLGDALANDTRSVIWGNIRFKPPSFPPAPHFHDLGDVYGFQHIVQRVEAIRQAVLERDRAEHPALYLYVDEHDQLLRNQAAEFEADMEAHEDNVNNPHMVTKAQVGLGSVQNFNVATQVQAEEGTDAATYVTPLRVAQYVKLHGGDQFDAHAANTNNPHDVTKAQVGLGSVVNAGVATLSEAQTGTGSNYMTSSLTKSAIDAQFTNPYLGHANRIDNPHGVTKTQVGLNQVQDYPAATTAEAQAGNAANRYMTPALTQAAIMQFASNALNAHATNTSNPHQVTKAQVGLGSVEDYPVATQAEAEAGTSNVRYMTPLRTMQAIAVGASNALAAHEANVSNPHAVTKTQVGLSNVLNYGIVTTAEAQAGTIHTKYMTPLRTKEAITSQALTPANAHINRTDNPHGVTKAQVGLGSVENFATATVAQAQAGTATNLFVTPAGVKAAITAQAGTILQAHVSNLNNPHQVTKEQVGLGNVQNFYLATAAHAQAGVVQDRYMNPYLVAEAIRAMAAGKWVLQGNATWGCVREPNTGLTIQWGSSGNIAVGQARILHFVRQWSTTYNSQPLALFHRAVASVINASDTGAWTNRGPFYSTWLKSQSSYSLPPGTSMPDSSRACVLALGRVANSNVNNADVGYIAIGHTTNDSTIPGNPGSGHGTVMNPYTPETELSLSLSPGGPSFAGYHTTTESGTVASGWFSPSASGGTGNITINWSFANDLGNGSAVSIERSGNQARVILNYSGLQDIGHVKWTDYMTLRCTATSGTQTKTADVQVGIRVERVYPTAAPTAAQLGFEVGVYVSAGQQNDASGWLFSPRNGRVQNGAEKRSGNWFSDVGPGVTLRLLGASAVSPGETKTVGAYVFPVGSGAGYQGRIDLVWLNNLGIEIGRVNGSTVTGVYDGNFSGQSEYRLSTASGVAPAGAAYYTLNGVSVAGQCAFDDFMMNYVAPPPGGGGGGGGDPSCVTLDMYLDAERQASDIALGSVIDSADYENIAILPRTVMYYHVAVQPVMRMVTSSGIALVASKSTPFDLRDGGSKFLPEMLGEQVLVDDNGTLRWEYVVELIDMGEREVAFIGIDNNSYFAGEEPTRRIASHNRIKDSQQIQ